MSKNKKKFLIKFWGETEIKAYTENEARYQVEMTKNIHTHRRVTTNSMLDTIAKGFVMNFAGIIQLCILLILITSFMNLLNVINNIYLKPIRLIALLVVLVLMLASIRLPKLISRYFEHRGH